MKVFAKAAVLIISLGLAFASCDLLEQERDPIEITGDWLDDYGGTLSVTEDSITSSWGGSVNWTAEIAAFDNDGWNAGEEGTGNCGYAVIKYTQASEYAPDSQDKFMVLRWQNLSTSADDVTTFSYAEGYGDYFENAGSAESGATDSAGYFGMYTDGAVRQ